MNHIVKFIPANLECSVPEGTLISEAATIAGITSLHLPCGGRGTCEKCTVEIITENQSRQVLACRTAIKSDLIVNLIRKSDSVNKGSIVADSPLSKYKWNPSDLSPMIKKVSFQIDPPTIEDNYADLDRFQKQLLKKTGCKCLQIGLDTLRKLAFVSREMNGLVTASFYIENGSITIIDIESGDTSTALYGIACDIGTTTIALHLISLHTGEIISTQSAYNAQISRGADIISRIEYARTGEKLEELRRLVVDTINELIKKACESSGVTKDQIYSMTVAGNCTMTHLFCGLQPRYIREHPYVPTINAVPLLSAAQLQLNINQSAPVQCSPGVGSYVGGDITSGLLCTELVNAGDSIALFIDIGTNGEIVIGNGDFLMTCACSAGPAFEGSGIKCGMRAATGAIDSFTIESNGRVIDYSVIGDGKPEGICGSGLISLVGELLVSGIIDRSGRFTEKADSSKRSRIEGTEAFVLVESSQTAHGKPIMITESDIDNLIRTKAAIYAACDLMLRNIGLDFSSLDKVLIAGGFGRFIDVEDAVRIGLFPDIDRSKFHYLGNTSLAGAAFCLLNESYRGRLKALPAKMTYVELSNDSGYMDSYTAALFLPHTDLSRFSLAQPINS